MSLPRAQRLAGRFGAQWLLVPRPEDIRWLTGFSGSTATALVDGDGRVVLFVDGRYVERAADEAAVAGRDVDVVRTQGGTAVIADVAARVGTDGISVDPHAVTAAFMDELGSRVHVVREPGPVAGLRRVKDGSEVELIERAAAIADAAIQTVVADGLAGRTEAEVRLRLDGEMLRLGADDVSFPTIVASGPNGARPHHEPSRREIVGGDMVVIDMGAAVGGYRSDMTRTVAVGSVDPSLALMHRIVAGAQAAGLSAVRQGAAGSEVDGAVRAVYREHGVEHEYLHGTGHGVGLVIHETPIMGPSCSEVLSAGEVVTVEPGLYRKGVGGVRIEDLVVVTATGCRILTHTPKELSCPPSARTT
jgi:Xaa-Pro aminopeptidase